MDVPNQQLPLFSMTAVDVDVLPPRARLLQKYSRKLPLTAEGLPVGYYRADLLPTQFGSVEEDQALQEAQQMKAAYVDLSYDRGYPTQTTGEPFWHRLPHEPGFAYGALQIYLELDDHGPRELTELANNEELLRLYSQIHQNSGTQNSGTQNSEASRVSKSALLMTLNEYSILYYWPQRARAYDLFKEAAYRHVRVRRAIKTENSHYEMATALIAKIQEYLATPDFMGKMSPKVALDSLIKLMAVQRVSVGLPSGGPLSSKEQPEANGFEMILRQLTQKHAAAAGMQQGHQFDDTESGSLVDQILQDPNSARNLQEIIIKVTNVRQGPQQPRGPSGRRVYSQEGEVIDIDQAGIEDGEDADFHRTFR